MDPYPGFAVCGSLAPNVTQTGFLTVQGNLTVSNGTSLFFSMNYAGPVVSVYVAFTFGGIRCCNYQVEVWPKYRHRPFAGQRRRKKGNEKKKKQKNQLILPSETEPFYCFSSQNVTAEMTAVFSKATLFANLESCVSPLNANRQCEIVILSSTGGFFLKSPNVRRFTLSVWCCLEFQLTESKHHHQKKKKGNVKSMPGVPLTLFVQKTTTVSQYTDPTLKQYSLPGSIYFVSDLKGSVENKRNHLIRAVFTDSYTRRAFPMWAIGAIVAGSILFLTVFAFVLIRCCGRKEQYQRLK